MVKRNYSKKRSVKGKGKQCGGSLTQKVFQRRGAIRRSPLTGNLSKNSNKLRKQEQEQLRLQQVEKLYSKVSKGTRSSRRSSNMPQNVPPPPLPPRTRSFRKNGSQKVTPPLSNAVTYANLNLPKKSLSRSKRPKSRQPSKTIYTNLAFVNNSSEEKQSLEKKTKDLINEIKEHYSRDDFIIIEQKEPKLSSGDKNYYFYISKPTDKPTANICNTKTCVGTVYYMKSDFTIGKSKLLYEDNEGLLVQSSNSKFIHLGELLNLS